MPDGSTAAVPAADLSSSPGAAVLAGHLLRAVRTAKLATERRNTIPILDHLLLRAEGGTLVVSGTDMERACRATAPCPDDLAPVTASARALEALLARIDEDAEVVLRSDPGLGCLVLSSAVVTARLMALPAEDVPEWQEPSGATRFTMAPATLLRLLTVPAHAISTEETRYYLNGIYLHLVTVEGVPKLRTVATDGHRLVGADEPQPAGAEGMPCAIVPRTTVASLRALLAARAEGTVRVAISDTRIEVAAGDWTFGSKLIDGTYPEYARVVPAARTEGRLKILHPRALARFIAMAGAVGSDRAHPVKLSPGSAETLRLCASGPDLGSTEVTVPVDVAAYQDAGKRHEIGFQSRYLAALCAAVPKGFTLQISGGGDPARIEFKGGFGALMPMRV